MGQVVSVCEGLSAPQSTSFRSVLHHVPDLKVQLMLNLRLHCMKVVSERVGSNRQNQPVYPAAASGAVPVCA